MILKYALVASGFLSFVGILTSTAATIYYGARLMGAYNDPNVPKYKKLGMLLLPGLVFAAWAQPPEKRKYAHRFAISIICLAVFIGIYELAKLHIAAIK